MMTRKCVISDTWAVRLDLYHAHEFISFFGCWSHVHDTEGPSLLCQTYFLSEAAINVDFSFQLQCKKLDC